MKLSNYTTSVLKNFSTINQNLVIKEGNTITTMSAMKNIVAKENKPTTKMKYFYSDPSVVTSPNKMITMPSNEVKFTMSSEDLSRLKRAAGAIGAPDMVLEKDGSSSSLTVKDKKNDTANNYSLDVDTTSEGEFNFYFKVENMKLLDGNYDVEISSKNISHYTNKSTDIEYWIALEPESTYTV